ncbi:MAG TPA: proton-conducting transporter membrane subunit, partial [Phototrophicaceae bacterium]|nr:proton-conducting transporter membrane subunit [Phototrophicaceae bacterium]
LFLVAGLIERRGGTTSLARLGSLSRVAPLLAILYFVPAMNLAGIPPMSGFLGKVGLIEAGAARGTALDWTLIGGSLLTSLLTLYAVSKAWNQAFWQEAPEPLPDTTIPRSMMGPTAALVAMSLAFTVVAGPLFDYTSRAARDLRAQTPYVSVVLPDGQRGSGQSSDVTEDAERNGDTGQISEDEETQERVP